MWRWVVLACLLSAPAGAVETMRISMGPPKPAATVRGQALAFGPDDPDGPFTPLHKGAVRVRAEAGRLFVDDAPVIGEAIRFRAGEAALDAGVPGQAPIDAGGIEVRGDVVARLVPGGVQLINVLPVEEYLAAVLGGEMPPSFPMEALKAQAVAARTYAIQKKLAALGQPYYLGSDVLSQVYGGVDREDPRTRQAVEQTRGEVLTYELQPIEAYFHASCGGRTASGREALGRDLPYLQSVSCPCGKLARTRWSLSVSTRELERAFGAGGGLEVVSRTQSGRVGRLRVGRKVIDGVTLRQTLGYERVRSLAFRVEPRAGGYLLEGRGFGHGAGLCQWGAKIYAGRGWSYRQILAHYYPGTELQRMY